MADRTDGPLPDIETVAIDVRVVLQQRAEPLDFVLGRVNRRVLRKAEIDDQLRSVGGWEELLLDEPYPYNEVAKRPPYGGRRASGRACRRGGRRETAP